VGFPINQERKLSTWLVATIYHHNETGAVVREGIFDVVESKEG